LGHWRAKNLAEPKLALFCSVRCPGDAILGAYDAAQKLRDDSVTVVSGFHSPVEKECLRILLRGTQPVIILPGAGFRENPNSDRLEGGVRLWTFVDPYVVRKMAATPYG
jgi:hypothetical protein